MRRNMTVVAAALLALLLTACGGGGGGGGTTNTDPNPNPNPAVTGSAPVVASFFPAKNATNTPSDGSVTVVFDKAMNLTSLLGSVTLKNASGAKVNGSISYNTLSKTLTFDPSASLAYDQDYTFTISTGAQSAKGANLAEAFVLGFSTGGEPKITAVSVEGWGEVGPYHYLAVPMTVTFSEPMNADTINGSSITLSDGTALDVTVTLDETNTTATITPNVTLAAKTLTLTVKTSARSLLNQPIAEANATLFTTTKVRPILKTGDINDGGTGEERSYSRDSANGIVTDHVTNLEWQDTASPVSQNRATAATACANLNLNGTGWRLPTIDELQTLVDYGTYAPAVTKSPTPGVFQNMPSEKVWSSSSEAGSFDTMAFVVLFGDGYTMREHRDNNVTTRCVRGAAAIPSSKFVRQNDQQIVIDTQTGLAWEDDGNITNDNYWPDAKIFCESLTLGGHDDWRMPSINELLSIADRALAPAVNAAFLNLPWTVYKDTWSSTTTPWDPSLAFEAYFNTASAYRGTKATDRYSVRCVRN